MFLFFTDETGGAESHCDCLCLFVSVVQPQISRKLLFVQGKIKRLLLQPKYFWHVLSLPLISRSSIEYLPYKSAIPNESGQAATMFNSSN